jgi:hypothetical protein
MKHASGGIGPSWPGGTRRKLEFYRVVLQKNLTYGVGITSSRTFPGTVPGFRTEQDAEAWIAEQKRKLQSLRPNDYRERPRDFAPQCKLSKRSDR